MEFIQIICEFVSVPAQRSKDLKRIRSVGLPNIEELTTSTFGLSLKTRYVFFLSLSPRTVVCGGMYVMFPLINKSKWLLSQSVSHCQYRLPSSSLSDFHVWSPLPCVSCVSCVSCSRGCKGARNAPGASCVESTTSPGCMASDVFSPQKYNITSYHFVTS